MVISVVRKGGKHTATSKEKRGLGNAKTISFAGRRDKLWSVGKKTHRLTHCYRMRTNDGVCHWNVSEILTCRGNPGELVHWGNPGKLGIPG